MANLDDAVSEEEKPLGNNNSLSLRAKIQRHTKGAMQSYYKGSWGSKAQTEDAILNGHRASYYTIWQTTFWCGVSLVYKHAPLFIASKMLYHFTDISEGDYFVLGNFAAGTSIDIYRFIKAVFFNKPLPAINVEGLITDIIHYRKNIKEFVIKRYKTSKEEMINDYSAFRRGEIVF